MGKHKYLYLLVVTQNGSNDAQVYRAGTPVPFSVPMDDARPVLVCESLATNAAGNHVQLATRANAKNAVCLFHIHPNKTTIPIDHVVKAAENSRVAALITNKISPFAPTCPVFYVPGEILAKISALRGGCTIRFLPPDATSLSGHPGADSSVSSSSDYDWEPPQPAQPRRNSASSHSSHQQQQRRYSNPSRSPNPIRSPKRSDSSSSSKSQRHAPKRTDSKRFMLVKPSHEKFGELVKRNTRWSSKSSFGDYREALELIDACRSNDELALKFTAIDAFTPGARKVMRDCLIFVLGARIWLRVNDEVRRGKFGARLGQFLTQLQFDDQKSTDLKRIQQHFTKHNAWMKPHMILQEYFSKMIQYPQQQQQSPESTETTDKYWINLIVLWSQCGLFSLPIEWENWEALRQAMDRDLVKRCWSKLTALMGLDWAITLDLCLHHDIDSLVFDIEQRPDKEHYSKGLKSESADFLGAITKPQTTDLSLGINYVSQKWESMMEVLLFVFPRGNYQNYRFRQEVIDKWVDQVSFSQCRTFRHYVPLILAVRRDHADFQHFKLTLQAKLRSDVGAYGRNITAGDAMELMDFPKNELLTLDVLISAVFKYVEQHLLPEGDNFGSILSFLNDACLRCSSSTTKFENATIRNRVADLVTRAVKKFGWDEALNQTLDMAIDREHNQLEGLEHLHSSVAGPIVDAISVDTFVRMPSSQLLNKIAAAASSSNALAKHIHRRFVEGTVASCKSMLVASSFYQAAVSEGNCNPSVKEVAKNVLVSSAALWKPTSIDSIFLETSRALELYVQSLNDDDECDETHEGMAELRNEFIELFTAFLEKFVLDQVNLSDLQTIKALTQKQSWEIVTGFLPINLMTALDVDMKISHYHSLLDSTFAALSAPKGWSHSLQHLLRTYRCYPGAETKLGRLFAQFPTVVASPPGEPLPESNEFQNCSLRSLVGIEREASQFRTKYDETLALCDLMTSNGSMFFAGVLQDAMAAEHLSIVDVESLRVAMERAKERMSTLFVPALPARRVEPEEEHEIYFHGPHTDNLSSERVKMPDHDSKDGSYAEALEVTDDQDIEITGDQDINTTIDHDTSLVETNDDDDNDDGDDDGDEATINDGESIEPIATEMKIEVLPSMSNHGSVADQDTNNPATRDMFDWLNSLNLPETVGKKLVQLGVRDMSDVLLVVEFEEILRHFPKLDRFKLKRAILRLKES